MKSTCLLFLPFPYRVPEKLRIHPKDIPLLLPNRRPPRQPRCGHTLLNSDLALLHPSKEVFEQMKDLFYSSPLTGFNVFLSRPRRSEEFALHCKETVEGKGDWMKSHTDEFGNWQRKMENDGKDEAVRVVRHYMNLEAIFKGPGLGLSSLADWSLPVTRRCAVRVHWGGESARLDPENTPFGLFTITVMCTTEKLIAFEWNGQEIAHTTKRDISSQT